MVPTLEQKVVLGRLNDCIANTEHVVAMHEVDEDSATSANTSTIGSTSCSYFPTSTLQDKSLMDEPNSSVGSRTFLPTSNSEISYSNRSLITIDIGIMQLLFFHLTLPFDDKQTTNVVFAKSQHRCCTSNPLYSNRHYTSNDITFYSRTVVKLGSRIGRC